jgi:dGTPase
LPKKPNNISDKSTVSSKDKSFFEEQKDMGLIPNKSEGDIGFDPLAYLVEAADDICYTIIDFEDGINLGLVSEDFEYLIKLVKDSTSKYKSNTTKEDRISYLRVLQLVV